MQPLTVSGQVTHDVNGQVTALPDVSVTVTTIADRIRCGTATSANDGTYTVAVNLETSDGGVACIVWFQKPAHQEAHWVVRTANANATVNMEMVPLFF